MQNLILLSILGLTPVTDSFDQNFNNQHDKGFYLRLELGAGYANLETKGPNSETENSGFGISPSVSMGWILEKNIALHLTGFGLVSRKVSRLGVGPGITYYFNDSFFASAAIGPMIGIEAEVDPQLSLAAEVSFGIFGWTGEDSQFGMTTYIAAEGLDLDNDKISQTGWRLGLRAGFSWH